MASNSPPSYSCAAESPSFPPPPPSSRRLPPPCWSHEETLALIHAYRDKWYSLGRGNLRSPHWDDVAAAVARDCPSSTPVPKTPVQCRHKIEKLRKRYRSEKQRLLSSWIFFGNMDAMEHGSDAAPMDIAPLRFTIPKSVRSRIAGIRSNHPASIKPGEEMRRAVGRMRMKRDEGEIGDVATALGMLGDRFLRIEQMKMDVSRELEKMKMEMELKRTEMILDCQRQIVETMVKRFMGK